MIRKVRQPIWLKQIVTMMVISTAIFYNKGQPHRHSD